jgi:uncharacterized membrane protein YebE (DUF533 family)
MRVNSAQGVALSLFQEMIMKKIQKAMLVLSFALPFSVVAQTATPNIDQRQANQEARIQQGTQSGSLTQREVARLERGQDRVDRMEDRAKADGKVTQQERKRIHKAENHQNRDIRREKHDRQHDFNHDGRKDRPHRRQ